MRKSKFIICCSCLFFLALVFFFVFFVDVYSSQKVDFSVLSENNEFVVGISSNNLYAAYDKNTLNYYFSKNLFNSKRINIESPYKVGYELKKVSDNEYTIFIFSDKYFQERTIKLLDSSIISINVPILLDDVMINNDVNEFNVYDRKVVGASFQIMTTDFFGTVSRSGFFNSAINLRVRGSSSTLFPKKSFKVEFPSKKSFFGMNMDDDWILDALYTDKSKIRNKLSYNLWNDINDNQSISNDLNGEYVEVFINNEYDGLFVLKQKVGRDILKISENGFLAKSINHVTDDIIIDLSSKKVRLMDDDYTCLYGNLELKNYTDESLEKFSSAITKYYTDFSFSSLSSDFDITNYLNYYIFVSLISGDDNVSKNLYYSMSNVNSKIIITPWDLDLTWGLFWSSSSELHSKFSMESSYDIDWMNNKITKNIDEQTFSLMKKRYWELRRDVITMDTINGYLDSYKEMLITSGAAERDSERWYNYDIEFEIEQIREWARRRIEFLDGYFK